MTSVGNIDNCYKYIYKNLLFFVFLLLMVSDLGLIQVSYADFPNDPVDTDITSAFGYDYGNDNKIECYEPDKDSKEVVIDNYEYVYEYKENEYKDMSYESNGLSSKFFKCVDLGYIVTGNFSAEDYAPCNNTFNYESYKNKLNYISFTPGSTQHLFVIANEGKACELNKIRNDKKIKLNGGFGELQGTGGTKDSNNNAICDSCYSDGEDCLTLYDALPDYVVEGGDKGEITKFYVFKKNDQLGIEKNRSTFPGQRYNCRSTDSKNFYLPPCGIGNQNVKPLYNQDNNNSPVTYDEYFQALNGSNTGTDVNCLVYDSSISYCSDLNEKKGLKYEGGLKYSDNGLPNCFLKSCADLTETELNKINQAIEEAKKDKKSIGKYCSEYRYLMNSNGLKYFPKNDLIKEKNGIAVSNNEKDRKAVYCSDLDSNGNLVFPSGQNKNKDNCYLKRCIALNAKERRKVILANLGNFDRKLARIDYEHEVIRGKELKCSPQKKEDGSYKYHDDCPEGTTYLSKISKPKLNISDNKLFGEVIKYTYHYSDKKDDSNFKNDTHYLSMNQGNIKKGLAKYCEDEVFFVNGKLNEFDDLLLNTLTSEDVKGGNCVDFTTLFINKDSYYSINNESYNSKTGDFYCRTLMAPVYNTEFGDSKSFVCNVVITKKEGGSSPSNVDKDIFPDCSISIENENGKTKSYGTYDKISIKDINIGSDYNNVLKNIDNTLLFLNAEILDLEKTDDYTCTAMPFNSNASDLTSCQIKDNKDNNDKDFFTKDHVEGTSNEGLPQCGIVNYDKSGKLDCETEFRVYNIDLLKTYNIPKFSDKSNYIINSKNLDGQSIEKFLVDINNYNFNNNTEYVNYQQKVKNEKGEETEEYVIKDSFFDCGLYYLVNFDSDFKDDGSALYSDTKYNVYYNNFSSGREFSTLVGKIKDKCKSKYMPLSVPQGVTIYKGESDENGKKYGQKPLSYDENGISADVKCSSANKEVGHDGTAFGCYYADEGTNTHFCKIPGDESFYIAEYRTLNGCDKGGKFIDSKEEFSPKKPGHVYLQVAACIRHPNNIFDGSQKCGEREKSGISSRCVVLKSNSIVDNDNGKGELSVVKNYITDKDLEDDTRSMLYSLSVDGTSSLASMYDLTAFRDENSNFFRTDRYGRDVYVFYDFATNYMCTTANSKKHRDYYAIAVITAECFGIGLAGGLVAGITATTIAAAFIFTLPVSAVIGIAVGTATAAVGFGICEGIRVGGGEADFTFSNDLYNMKDYHENGDGNGFYSNLNITNNNNTLYNYYRRSDNLKEDLKYKLEGRGKNYAGEYGDKNVLSREIIKNCGLEDFVVRERVCWDGGQVEDGKIKNGIIDKSCLYADWSIHGGDGENYQYLIQNYNANFDDQDNLKCKYKYFHKSQGLGSSEEKDGYTRMCVISINEDDKSNSCFDKPENCLTDEQKKCLREYGVHFFTNAQKLMDKNKDGINYLDFLKGYGDGYFTRAAYGTLDYNNGIVSINMVESAQNAVGEGNTKMDCKLDEYGNPIGDLQKCRGYSYCKEYNENNTTCSNNSEVFVKENQSIKIGLQTSPQPFFTIANPQNTYDLFKPFLELVSYYPYDVTPNSDYSNANNYEGYDFKLNLFNPVLLFKYDFPGLGDKFKNEIEKVCKGDDNQNCSKVWAEIKTGSNRSRVYNLKYKSEKGGDRVDDFYFYLTKEFTVDGGGVEIPTVCLHQLDLPSKDSTNGGSSISIELDGVQYIVKERNIFCYDRKYPSVGDIFMKPTKNFSYKNSYINVTSKNINEKITEDDDISSRFGNNVYAYTKITDNTKFNIENDAKNNVQNLVFSFKRNECTRLENDYYMNQFEINNNKNNYSHNKLVELQEDNKYIKSTIKLDCNLQNGSPYYVVSGNRKYKLKKNYGAYGGFNEVCLSNRYVNKFKSEDNLYYDVVAYQNENSVDGKCFLDKLSRSSNSCLVSKKVYAPCEDIYGKGDICKKMYHTVDKNLEVIDVIDSTTGESTKIVGIDCESFTNNVVNGKDECEYEYAKNNPELYINKMKACYKGGYNSKLNLYSDKNKYVLEDGVIKLSEEESKAKSDYSCSCMQVGNDDDYKKIKNSIDNGLKNLKNKNFYSYFASRAPTARELSLCVDLVDTPKCDAVEYRTVEGTYIDPDLSVPEQVSDSMLVLGNKVDCYPNMSCSKDASTTVGAEYNAGLNQHFWRTNEKLFGVLDSSIYGSLGHAEFESTLYCENDTSLCVVKNNSNVTGSCNGYWTVGNSAPTAVCRPVNCNKFKNKDACKSRYDSVDTSGFALDENGDYVYEYDLNENSSNCVRYKCPGIFSDIKQSFSVDNSTINTVRSIVTDEIEFSSNAHIVKGSVTDGENSNYGLAISSETDFRNVNHFIDYSNIKTNIDQRGRSHGFAVWTETDEDGNVLDGIESSDIVQLATANRCLTGYAPAGTNYNREMRLDNIVGSGISVTINQTQTDYEKLVEAIDDQDLYCEKKDNDVKITYDCEGENNVIGNKQKTYMELIKSQVDYIYNNYNDNNIINKDRLPKRYCGQRGNWLDTRDIYSNKLNDIEHILYYTGNETWLNTLLYGGYLKINGSKEQLFNTTTDGVYNKKPTKDYEAGYISSSDSNRYCERLFCPDVSIDRYDLGENIDQIEYDIYGMEKRPDTSVNSGDFDNKIYSYTDKYVKGADNKITRYTTWKHTAGATWENIAAPRNDSRKLCIGESCSDSKNINKILEDRSVPDNLDNKNINKFLKKVRGICHTEYGYYERNSKFKGQEPNQESSNQNKNSDADAFMAQLIYIKQALEENKKDIFGSQDIDISSSYDSNESIDVSGAGDIRKIYDDKIIEHSIDPRKLSMQQLELDDEKIPVSGVLYKVPNGDYVGIEPTRTCNSAGIWSGVSDGCFRACEMLDLYNVKVSKDVSDRRFDSFYRYYESGEGNIKKNVGKSLYVKNSDIKAIQIFNGQDNEEKNYRNIFNIVQSMRLGKSGVNDLLLKDIEKTKAGTLYGDYLTGGAMWPRTVVKLGKDTFGSDLSDSKCGEIECVDITKPHEGYDGDSKTQRQHCETVRCDSNGKRLRYIEVSGVCDNRFNTNPLDKNALTEGEDQKFIDEARNYSNNKTHYNNGAEKGDKEIIPMRRCYEDGVWGPVYGPTRCVLERSCKLLYFNPKNLYYLIDVYEHFYEKNNTNKKLIDSFEDYIKSRSENSDPKSINNLELIKDLIKKTQELLNYISINTLKFDEDTEKDTIFTKDTDYTSTKNTNLTMGVLKGEGTNGSFQALKGGDYDSVIENSYKKGYVLYCNMSAGNPWLLFDNDTSLENVCNQYNSFEQGSGTDYECAKYADLGEMIKPKVCNDGIYKVMKDSKNNGIGVVYRLKHKTLRDPNVKCDEKDESECKTTTSRINGYNSKEDIINDNYDVEMYVKTSYLHKVYNEQKMGGLININENNKFGNEFNKFEDSEYYKKYYSNVNLENESMKNITLGTHEYISFQGHTKCDEDYFYNSKLTDKQYGIDDYQVVYECRLDNNKDTKIGFPSEDKKDNEFNGKIISPFDCAPKYCGERSKYVSAHRNWTKTYVGKVATNHGAYGYFKFEGSDTAELILSDQYNKYGISSLQCPAGYAFVIQNHGEFNNKKIDSDLYKNKKNIIEYYEVVNNQEINNTAKEKGWVKSINLGCYANDYDINKSIENGISIPLDRTFGRLGADGIDYNTTITFCKDIAQTDCHNLTLAQTFNENFLDDAYFNKNEVGKGYCVYMGCRFKNIDFIRLEKTQTVDNTGNYSYNSSIIRELNGCKENQNTCEKDYAELQFGDTIAVGGESAEYDKCNYTIGDSKGQCNISGINLCPNGYDQYTKGIKDPLGYKGYIFSKESKDYNSTKGICKRYVDGASVDKNEVYYNDKYNKFIKPYSDMSFSGNGSIGGDDVKKFDKLIVEYVNNSDNDFKNEVVWNACINSATKTSVSYGTYCGASDGVLYYDKNSNNDNEKYYNYTLSKCNNSGTDNLIIQPKNINIKYNSNTNKNDITITEGYYYNDINNCYAYDSELFRSKFDNLNSTDGESVGKINFDKIKEKFNKLSGNCLYATNDNFINEKCSYDENFLNYQKLLTMKKFLNIDKNLDLYEALINNYIEDVFGEEMGDVFNDLGDNSKNGDEFTFGFDENKLNVCHTLTDNKLRESRICIVTNVDSGEQGLYTMKLRLSLLSDIEPISAKKVNDNNYNSILSKLQKYTNILYNDFLDYTIDNNKITGYELNKNKKDISDLKGNIDKNCSPVSDLFKGYISYYKNIKDNNDELNRNNVKVNEGFYTLLRCDLATGKIKTYGEGNKEMLCAGRCSGVVEANLSDYEDKEERNENTQDGVLCFRIDPKHIGDYNFYFIVNNLRYNETLYTVSHSQAQSAYLGAETHEVWITCDGKNNNGEPNFTTESNRYKFDFSWKYKGGLHCPTGISDNRKNDLEYSYGMFDGPHFIGCRSGDDKYNQGERKAILEWGSFGLDGGEWGYYCNGKNFYLNGTLFKCSNNNEGNESIYKSSSHPFVDFVYRVYRR